VNEVRKILAGSFDCFVGRHGRLGESKCFEVWVLWQSRFYIETISCNHEVGCRGSVFWDIEPYICIEWLQGHCCVLECVCVLVCVC
jgi:hypothetical protein